MKFLNLTTSTLAAAVLLTACQGQNPFKRESNPVRDYPKVSESIRTKKGLVPYDHTQPPPAPPPDNSQAICNGAFAIRINGNFKDSDLLDFPEDRLTSHEIQITNRFGDDFQLKTKGFPKDAEFRLLKKLAAGSAVYQLSYNPKRLPPGLPSRRHKTELILSSPNITKLCNGGSGSVLFTLFTEKQGTAPIVSASEIPQTPVVYGGQASFKIKVSDASGVQPVLNKFFTRDSTTSAGANEIDGSKAMSCLEVAEPNGTNSWIFNCRFDSNFLAENPAAVKLFNSNKTVKVVALVSASSRNFPDVISFPHQVTVRVKFEKVIEAGPTVSSTPGAKK